VSKNKKDQTTTKGAAISILLIMVAVLMIGIILFSDKLKSSGMSLSEIIGGIRATQPTNVSHPQEKYVPDEILVKFKPGVAKTYGNKLLQRYGLNETEEIPQIKVKVLKVNPEAQDAVIEALSHNPAVEYVEKNGIAEALFVPNDLFFISYQWNLPKIQADYAWNITTGTSNVKIAILDTGIDMDHPDLASKIVSATDFTGSSSSEDVFGHGTHCAGIAAAATNNGIGVAGTCPGCSLMNVKVMNDTGWGTWSMVANGIIWAADNGANVISMSLGASDPSSAVEDAINYSWNKGVVVVAAAGNSGNNIPHYPAYYTNSIAVAATDWNDYKASFSNYGDWVDVAAPGVNILSTFKGHGYGTLSGTSMACPHVAGLAGMLFAITSDANGDGKINDEVRLLVESTSDDIGIDVIYGRINAYSAVTQSSAPDTTPPILSSIQATGITYNSAAISWTTDDYGNSTVYYGTASPNLIKSDSNLVTSHSIALTGLSSNTNYYYQVKSCNSNGYCSTPSTYSFRTLEVLPTEYTLTVSKTGSGTVTSNPAGISCGSTCSANYNSSTSVSLTATPDSGYTFAEWSGACTGTGACTVTMIGAKSVTATFIITTTVTGVLQSCNKITSPGCDQNWNYVMGYKFTPNTNGQITNLCGYFSGTKTVKLYSSSYAVLASASVTSFNSWSCTSITPVSVTSGSIYYVAAELTGSGGCFQPSINLPAACGSIVINAAAYQNPSGTFDANHNEIISNMYGIADAVFSPSPDTIPPVRLNGQPTGNLAAGTKQTTISLTTNEVATCKYSTTAGVNYDSMTSTFSTTGNTSHSQLITGLADGNSYKYYVKCSDSYGNKNTDDYLISFSVSVDITPPTVSITSPANGATISGIVTISASASDNIAVTKVEFYRDGTLIGTDTISPYSMSWNTALLSNGLYTLQTKAYDTANNVGTSSLISVTVNNPLFDFTLSLNPYSGSVIQGSSITTTATATLTSGPTTSVSFSCSNLPAGASCSFIPTSCNPTCTSTATVYTTDSIPVGSYSITITGTGGVTKTTTYTLTVLDARSPTVSIISPSSGSTVSGPIIIQASASDNVGVSKVELYIDGVLFVTDSSYSYEFFWDTTTVGNGAHTLVAKAYDAANNVGTSATVIVTVNNVADPTPPTVIINSPSNGATVKGTVRISASATDNVGVSSIEVYIDGILKASSTSSSITYSWNTNGKKVTSGWHTITAKAYDQAGNVGTSSITVKK